MMRRVLVLENDPDVLDIIKEILSFEGYHTKGITCTDDIFQPLTDYKPDIVLVDYVFDGINGGEICHQIKNSSSTSKLPVILLSSYPRILKPLAYYGCDAFIAKPFDLPDLTSQVEHLLQSVPLNHHYLD